MADWRLLQALTSVAGLRILCRRQLNHNLPVGVPKGRPFCSSSAAFFGGFVPSGLVPGDEVAGRDWKLRRELGGHGLDCFSHLSCRVFSPVLLLLFFSISNRSDVERADNVL
jgi:hypothetical protein